MYSLPTEAQWEYACRAGTTTSQLRDDSDDVTALAWYVKTTGPFNRANMPRIQPVAQKQPNAWGLYDMLGNAREWVLDYIGPYPGGSVTDPRGPQKPVQPNFAFRVQRGGAWIDREEQTALRMARLERPGVRVAQGIPGRHRRLPRGRGGRMITQRW